MATASDGLATLVLGLLEALPLNFAFRLFIPSPCSRRLRTSLYVLGGYRFQPLPFLDHLSAGSSSPHSALTKMKSTPFSSFYGGTSSCPSRCSFPRSIFFNFDPLADAFISLLFQLKPSPPVASHPGVSRKRRESFRLSFTFLSCGVVSDFGAMVDDVPSGVYALGPLLKTDGFLSFSFPKRVLLPPPRNFLWIPPRPGMFSCRYSSGIFGSLQISRILVAAPDTYLGRPSLSLPRKNH